MSDTPNDGTPPPPPPSGGTPPPPPPSGGTPPPPPPSGGTPPPPPPAPPTAPSASPPPPPAPPTYYATTPAPPNNGLAVAAMVIGIVAIVWSIFLGWIAVFPLGIIGGILALVLGIVGMKKAAELKRGRGAALTGVITGILAIVISLLWIVFWVVLIDNASDSIDDWSGEVDPSTISWSIKECALDSFDSPMMTIEIENKTSSSKSYTFDYEFKAGNGSVISTGTSFPESVPGKSRKLIEISSFESTTASTVRCNVKSVNNWFN